VRHNRPSSPVRGGGNICSEIHPKNPRTTVQDGAIERSGWRARLHPFHFYTPFVYLFRYLVHAVGNFTRCFRPSRTSPASSPSLDFPSSPLKAGGTRCRVRPTHSEEPFNWEGFELGRITPQRSDAGSGSSNTLVNTSQDRLVTSDGSPSWRRLGRRMLVSWHAYKGKHIVPLTTAGGSYSIPDCARVCVFQLYTVLRVGDTAR